MTLKEDSSQGVGYIQDQAWEPIGTVFDNWQAGGYAGGLGGCACPVTNPASFRPMGHKVDVRNTKRKKKESLHSGKKLDLVQQNPLA